MDLIQTEKSKLNLYFIFHCNLSYSSIHEEDFNIVIEKCYWPLLELCQKYHLPIGIELSGYTLEKISELERAWVEKFKDLQRHGVCEAVGSGYAQVIAPLVPQKVNEKNMEMGLNVYDQILGIKPNIAYVNEQAYSAGVTDVYLNSGFDAIFMEWNNVYSANNGSWRQEWQYYPQYAISAQRKRMPVIWNNAVSFQRLQRYVHGEISLEEYSKYLESHAGINGRSFCMYGNDVEIFDFRPGRYHTEAELNREGEWKRLEELLIRLQKSGAYSFILPSEVLKTENENAFNELTLNTTAIPIPVKKQSKYNITRWALTGRDDVRNNGSCFNMYTMIEKLSSNGYYSEEKVNEYWKELCYLWGSDFRTHIIDNKYSEFIKRQGILECMLKNNGNSYNLYGNKSVKRISHDSSERYIGVDNHYYTVETGSVKITVNSRRGMAIDSLIFKEFDTTPLIGTLHQGYYCDMSWGVDLYSGHVIIQPVNHPKITDLDRVEITTCKATNHCLSSDDMESEAVAISCDVVKQLGVIHKTIYVYKDDPKIEIEYVFDWNGLKDASFHAGILTFNPENFDEDSLFYATHNGGPEETYYLKGHDFNHSSPVAHSVLSATHCLGTTEGIIRIGDKDKTLLIKSEKYPVAAQPMIAFQKADDRFLLRLYHSLGEHDETSYWMWKGRTQWNLTIELET